MNGYDDDGDDDDDDDASSTNINPACTILSSLS